MRSPETVTLLRSTVSQVLEALFCTDSDEDSPAYELELEAVKALREALNQPQRQPLTEDAIRKLIVPGDYLTVAGLVKFARTVELAVVLGETQ